MPQSKPTWSRSLRDLEICIFQLSDSDIHEALHEPFPTFLAHLLPLSTLNLNPPAMCVVPPIRQAISQCCFCKALHLLVSPAHSSPSFEVFFTTTSLLRNLTFLLYSCFSTIFWLSFPHPRSLFRHLFLIDLSTKFYVTDVLYICYVLWLFGKP